VLAVGVVLNALMRSYESVTTPAPMVAVLLAVGTRIASDRRTLELVTGLDKRCVNS